MANIELQEEVGFKSNKLIKLQEFYPTNQSAFKFHIYLAHDLIQSKLEKDEFEAYLNEAKFTFTEAKKTSTEGQPQQLKFLSLFFL